MDARRDEPKRIETAANLTWPPTKEDLERLYVDEHLSAMKISKQYGLVYPNPKSGETLILYHLKRHGVSRRDAAEHIRKVTEETVDEWVKRYEAGESLKQIAGEEVNPVTVFNHLRKRGLQLRDKVEAQIKAVTKHPRREFSGDQPDMAYMLGFARGDLWVTTHGRAVRVRGGSTHPAFIELFHELFAGYGKVYLYPKKAKLTDHEWSMDVDLDHSFRFLLERDMSTFEGIMTDTRLFMNYLAGFFDAEGSIFYHRKGNGGAFELSISNNDLVLLERIKAHLVLTGYSPTISKVAQTQSSRVIQGQPYIWQLRIWRHDEVSAILRNMPLRHSEKTAKRAIALDLPAWPSGEARSQVLIRWSALLEKIENEVKDSINQAGVEMDTPNQSHR
jgi:LAGLIDADG-like domain